MDANELAGSCDSILEQELLKENINKQVSVSGPRIRKPEEETQEDKGIRGRRKGLYSPKKINTMQQNQPSKPAIAPKPRNLISTGNAKPGVRLPGSPRGTRSTQLRQLTKTRLGSPPSPKLTPKSNSRIRAPLASPANSTISSTSSGSNSSR